MLAVVALVGFVLVVIGLIHLYLWKRLVADTTGSRRLRRAGAVVAALLTLLVPATLAGTQNGLYWLAWPGYVWLALMFYLLVVLAVLEVPLLVARLALRRRAVAAEPAAAAPEPVLVGAPGAADPPAAEAVDPPDHDPARRLLLARSAAIFAGLTAAGTVGYGVRNALGPPRLDRVQIPLAKLPRGMDGLRIATVSDIHLGPLRGRAHTERIVAMINRLDADLVAVVGDLVDGSVAELGEAAAPLGDLRSRYGSFFVTGNHEYYSGVEEWVREVDRIGLRVLQNVRQEIRTPAGVLDLAGVNDVTAAGTGLAGPADFAAALGDRDPSRPVVLLAHQPVAAVEAARFGVDLQLSGHTHGGQMVPFNLAVRLQQPVVSGLGEVDGTKVYVTNGAGFWGPPVRVGANPQVTLVELRAP
ncbi:metallophosphoesterase [Micromonospora carbonacea]|uniref:metallophosphoesterase n=1 Tax=Micromonospora carbonacea TaxID=47853 RepID=UPI0016124F9C|nr:metallophosphoesterase [Micromonospora carbonacea]MBB5829865.1 putative MPP superfamily phosphohydrolase [Micromonospora carbonacea]